MLEAEEDFEACEVLWRGDLSVARGFICGEGIYLWRGDLSPLGGEAAPKMVYIGISAHCVRWFYDCCAVERG